MKFLTKRRIFTPGPTPILPEAAAQALVYPMHHRKADFVSLFGDVQRALRHIYKTENDVLLLTCSGSGAMEAALTNLLAHGEKAIVGVAGKFGERWLELAEKYGVRTQVIRVAYGESVSPADVAAGLDSNPDASAVFIQAMETSTGAATDLEGISRVVREKENTVLVVDAITGLGTMPIETDAWGLDIVIGGSQKAFMAPPGVATLSVSEKAWHRIGRCTRPRFYFDLLRERKGQRDGQTAYTPAISVIQAMKSSMDLILALGIDGLIANAALQAGATRAAVSAWGLKLFPRIPANAITAFEPGVDPARVIAIMQDRFGALISGGQGSMKGRILRIGHLGYFDFLETVGLIGCLELALAEAGASIESGTGTRAALDYYSTGAAQG